MDFIVDILIEFYNALGMPFKFARKFFTNNQRLAHSASKLDANQIYAFLSNEKLRDFINSLKKGRHLLFTPKKVKAGFVGWSVGILNENMKYLDNTSVFIEETAIPEEVKCLCGKLFIINNYKNYTSV